MGRTGRRSVVSAPWHLEWWAPSTGRRISTATVRERPTCNPRNQRRRTGGMGKPELARVGDKRARANPGAGGSMPPDRQREARVQPAESNVGGTLADW